MAIKKFKILAFDPGFTTTGWSLIEGNTSNGDLVVLKIGEIHPGPTADKSLYRDQVEKFDKRTISLGLLREQVTNLINGMIPDFIVSEDIFINMHRPRAFEALCMWICTVRMLCRDLVGKYLVTIPTKICKKEIASSGSSDKLDVQDSISKNKHIKFKDPMDLQNISEHQADSIAVGYAFSSRYRDLINKEIEAKYVG